MAGKAPSRRRDKTHNSRPYDRPNQSILGKVASKVKDLLTPSWLFSSVPNWIRAEDSNNASSPQVEDEEEEDLIENEEDSVRIISKPRLPTRTVKRPRYDNNVGNTAIDSPSFWLGPSTSQGSCNVDIEDTEVSPVIPNCDDRKKDPVIINGDDHSENSDNSASTSGCSSLISSQEKPHRSSGLKLSESALEHLRGELMRKSTSKPPRTDVSTGLFSSSISSLNQTSHSLWSCGTQTPKKSFPPRPSPSNRPSFNVSSYGKPSVLSNSVNSKIASPFYDGNTTFGGASAYRRSIAPYQIDNTKSLRSQLQVKEKPASENSECMSSAALRILHTLEKMSTPIGDAKRMPSTQSPLDNPLTVNPPSQRFIPCLTSTRTCISSPKAPPMVNLKAVSKVPLLKSRSLKPKRNSMMEIPIQPRPSLPLSEECVKTPEEIDSSRSIGGGKMRSNREFKFKHQSNPEYRLPNVSVALPSTSTHNFLSQQSSDRSNVCEKTEMSKSEDIQFKFSEPIEHCSPTLPLHTSEDSPVQFKFSEPIGHSDSITIPLQATTMTGSSLSKYSFKIKPSERENAKDEGPPAKRKELILHESVNVALKRMEEASRMADKVTTSVNESDKRKDTLVKTTDLPKNKISNPSSVGFDNKFKPKPGSWDCGTCLIRNENEVQECVACTAPRPSSSKPPGGNKTETTSGFGDQFKPQEGTWECLTCMLRNGPSLKKCKACETPKPLSNQNALSLDKGKEKPVTCDLRFAKETPKTLPTNGPLFQSTSNTWECDTCLVRNPLSISKCVACETLRPSANKNQQSNNISFKFGGSNEKSSNTFTFGSLASTSVPNTTLTYTKFGNPSSTKPSTEVVSTTEFKFGIPSQTTTKPLSIFEDKQTMLAESSKNESVRPLEGIRFGTTTLTTACETSSVTTLSHSDLTEKKSSAPEISGFKLPITTSSTATSVISGGFKLPITTSSTATSVISGGFKLPLTTPSTATSVMPGGFKFGAISEKSNNVPNVKETSSISMTSDASLKDNTSIQSNMLHSTFGIQTPHLTSVPISTGSSVELNTKTVPSTLSSTVPVFKFPAPTSIAVSSVSVSGNSTVSTSTLFGNVSSKVQQHSFPFSANEKSKEDKITVSVPSTLPQVTPAVSNAIPSSFGTSQFDFGPSVFNNPFSSSTSQASSIKNTQTPAVIPLSTTLPASTSSGTGGFIFGNQNAIAPTSMSFGSSSLVTSTSSTGSLPNPSVFKFGATPSANEPKPGGFAFRSSVEKQSSFTPANAPNVFGGAPASTGATAAPFQFGTSSSQPSGAFVFSAAKTEATPTPSTFSFGSDSASTKSTFSPFQSTQATTTAVQNFAFGNNLSNATSDMPSFKPPSAGGLFSFGAKPLEITNPHNPMLNPSPAFGAVNPVQTGFGSSGATTFGSSQPTGGFNFGAAAATPSATPFVFGAPAEKKPTIGTTQGSGFNFMMPQSDTSNNFPSTNFNITTPPSFNFGAASTPTNQPFQFAATGEPSSSNGPPAGRRIRKAIRRAPRRE